MRSTDPMSMLQHMRASSAMRIRSAMFSPISRQRVRRGLSLMETMLATSVLLGSIVALSQLASIGRQHSERAARMTEAQIACENLLAEIAMGLRQPKAIQNTAVPAVPGWVYSVDVQETAWENLVSVEVAVRQVDDGGSTNGGNKNSSARSGEEQPTFRLVRWLPARPQRKSRFGSPNEDEDDGDDGRVGGGMFGGSR